VEGLSRPTARVQPINSRKGRGRIRLAMGWGWLLLCKSSSGSARAREARAWIVAIRNVARLGSDRLARG
jgi:hypothetical protein